MSEKDAKQWLVGAANVFCTQCSAHSVMQMAILQMVFRKLCTAKALRSFTPLRTPQYYSRESQCLLRPVSCGYLPPWHRSLHCYRWPRGLPSCRIRRC